MSEDGWKDPDLMRRLYREEEMTQSEIADEVGCSHSTVNKWLRKHGITGLSVDPGDYDLTGSPWLNAGLMRELYVDEQVSAQELSIMFGCSMTTVNRWLGKHEIQKRTASEAQQSRHGTLGNASYTMNNWGHMVACSNKDVVLIHRLMAVAKWSVEAIEGMHVHHKSGIPWDNRMENLELVTNEEHGSKHQKLKGLDRLRVAELYENGDISYRKLHDVLDYDHVTWSTLMEAHHEFYGGQSSA